MSDNKNTATLRQWLNEHEFDWISGTIIFQDLNDEAKEMCWSPGSAALEDIGHTITITSDHKVLDREFYCGLGGPEAPRILAKDKNFMYVIVQYDGATWMEKIAIDFNYYLNNKVLLPYI